MAVILTDPGLREATGKRGQWYRIYRCWLPDWRLDRTVEGLNKTRIAAADELAIVEAPKGSHDALRKFRKQVYPVGPNSHYFDSVLVGLPSCYPASRLQWASLDAVLAVAKHFPEEGESTSLPLLPSLSWVATHDGDYD